MDLTPFFPKSNDVIAEEAADWVVDLADGNKHTRKAFAVWLRQSPLHIKEFLYVSAIWETLPGYSAVPSAAELAQLAHKQPTVVALPGVARNGSMTMALLKSYRQRWMAQAAAVLVVVAASAIFLFLSPGKDPNLYTTEIGEQSSVQLPDGSLVTLNTQSTMRVAYTEVYRDVHLTDGEALFDVMRDNGRSFRVITPQAVFQAVGTEFIVRQNSDKVTITVIDGVVDVLPQVGNAALIAVADDRLEKSGLMEPLRLEVGQQAQVAEGVVEATAEDVDVEDAVAWRQRRLIFDALPLKQVIEEFNRYVDPPVEIEERKLESLPISGVFRSNDRDSFPQFLSQMKLAKSYVRADGTVVLTGGPGDEPRQ